jgi:hypothetical protein
VRELIDARFLDEQEEQHTGLYVALADPADSGFTTGAVLSDLSNAATPSDAMPPLKHFPADHFNTASCSSSPDLSNAATLTTRRRRPSTGPVSTVATTCQNLHRALGRWACL